MTTQPSNEQTTLAMDPYARPDEQTLKHIADLSILSEDGTKLPFHSLLTSPDKQPHKHLIVFIRHFYCGNCEDYVRALSTSLPPSVLSTTIPPTTLTIIGCGQPSVVADYKHRTHCPFPIYCDPDRALYSALGMVQNLELGPKKPEYVQTGMVGGLVGSAMNILGSGMKARGGGNYSQNGGEWVWDERGVLVWCHRMRFTRDHAEIGELKSVLGIEG